jgi:hypothetical protein
MMNALIQLGGKSMSDERIDLRRTRTSLFYLVAYLFPLATGLLISPTGAFHLLGSRAEHATTAWRLFGALLFVLAIVVVRLIREHRSAAYINTAIGRVVFVGLFSYLVGKTGNPAYTLILIVLGFGEAWTLVALAVDLRELLSGLVGRRTSGGDR